MNDDELFLKEVENDLDIPVDSEAIVQEIDMDSIDEEAELLSQVMCKSISDSYFNEEFMKKNPNLKKRLDAELESFRVLIKMRKSDERVHDILIKAISQNSGNASLYAALTKIQSSLLGIQKQMDETTKNINTLLKNVQLEFNFDNDDIGNEESDESFSLSHRGSKSFIESITKQLEEAK